MTHAAPAPAPPLFVELSGSGFRHVFEFEAANDRAFLVGSSRQADFRVDRDGIAAVEFHLERSGADVWLVPAYRARRLRVNGVPIASSVKIGGRLLLALSGLELELRLLPDDADMDETSRSSSAPRPLPANYLDTLPTDTACTLVAMSLDAEPALNMLTQPIPSERWLALAPQATERIAPLRPASLQNLQQTERLAPLVGPPPPALDESTARVALLQTQRIAPVTAAPPLAPPGVPAPASKPVHSAAPVASERARAVEPAPLATQETTAFDVTALAQDQPALDSQAVAASTTSRPEPQPLTKRAAMPPGSSVTAFLTQLGILTKQRPVLIVGGGLVGSLVLALALVGAARVASPARVEPKVAGSPPRAAPSTQPSASAPNPAPLRASAIVVVKPPSAEAKPSGRAKKGAADPELIVAVGHLAAGRVGEASASYRTLSARHEGGDVYAKASSLLARRTAECVAPSQLDRCPELLK